MPVTVKVDIYSYGILLLELNCCRRNFEPEADDDNQMILADWVYDCYAYWKMDYLVENDEEAEEDMKRVKKFFMVALWCVQEDPSLRPTMKKVIQMLEGTIEVSVPPDPNSLFSSL
ncbi:Tyrosine-protein kinase [Parasponia andersonii]|uniref:Tyrosine-protein kinase n=1 Tax=Parasponia andersonii TaxID=3476 RepID=A0A2P5D8X2_PARAD|nr:Tyrosine-protein kinase [Parasponia andersonii]